MAKASAEVAPLASIADELASVMQVLQAVLCNFTALRFPRR
jgi:hypothetical protein